MNPVRPRQPQQTGESNAPVELPHVLVRVAPDGTLTATVYGTLFPAAAESGAWTRATFGQLTDAITQDRTITVRVEVRESDGTVFTDIIHARKPPRTAVPPDNRLIGHADSATLADHVQWTRPPTVSSPGKKSPSP